KLEKYPLTEEQKRAAIINEDRNLLIAAAGSGKSSTIVAKAIYLIESGLATPEQILVLAYNKDAQVEINERLDKLVNISPRYDKPIDSRTFHGLGSDILISVEKKKPAISEMATASKNRLALLFQNLIQELITNSPQFAADWLSYMATCKHSTPDLETIRTYREYNDFNLEQGGRWNQTREGRRVCFTTMNGYEVKSLEELRIANWLTINGISFEYERAYENDTADEHHRQYYPDFYYPEVDLYHEHFALNKSGRAPKFMRNYEEGVVWKRNLHEINETKLIETHSAHVSDGSIFEHLESELKSHGIRPKPISGKKIDQIISSSFNPEMDTQLFSTFLRHYKANNVSIEELRTKAMDMHDKTRSTLFISLFESIYQLYQTKLHQLKEIDFEDQINLACNYIEQRKYKHPYKYILVDEFQDISQDRKRMVLALLGQHEDIKLFAVGDDWQSIYRFSGADINIMTHFATYFGVTSQNHLTQTFRSYQGIVDIAAEFVQRNDNQIKKQVTAYTDIPSDQVFVYEYTSMENQLNQVSDLLEKMNQTAVQNNQRLSVFLLARYNHIRPKSLGKYQRQFTMLDIDFKSVHGSKGLEADYVILLNVESGDYGFPSTITDDLLLQLVIPQPETYPHAEERRLMYVAITRAKRSMFIFSSKSRPSDFTKEIAQLPRVKAPKSLIPDHPCPECDTGELRIRVGKYGGFWGCTNYPDCKHTEPFLCPECKTGSMVSRDSENGRFLGCSNYPRCKHTHNL
ncbi:MAG: UvrD-helicase domain-containing protein, partial [Gammaproteobacteria bacterium]|nr:UvrD-helicase domain-containing protein [Gammaproteobacteria bacterium]